MSAELRAEAASLRSRIVVLARSANLQPRNEARVRENIRYMLALHRERQVAFGKKLKSETDEQHQTIYALFTRLLVTC